nr:MAG TPA: hypothetical protein [Caudoviricetes sp.]
MTQEEENQHIKKLKDAGLTAAAAGQCSKLYSS